MPIPDTHRTHSSGAGSIGLLLLASVLGGCAPSLLTQPAGEGMRSYLLEWQPDAAAPDSRRTGPVLLVSPVLAAPGFDSSDMAYVRTPHQIDYYARHRWVDAPARMLEPLLVRAAAHSGLYRDVAETGTGARADLRLDSKLLRLQQLCTPAAEELQLALRVTLVKIASARVVGSRVLDVREPLPECSPYAGVAAANRAVARLLSGLQAFLATPLHDARK